MNLILDYESSALAAPQSFRDAMQTAANILDATIQNNITVTIDVGYGDYYNNQITGLGTSAEGGDLYGSYVSYTTLRAALASHETSTLDQTFVNSLPNTTSVNGMSGFYVPSAIEKALGMISPTASAIDGAVGIGTQIPTADLVGVALHELTHAMGREPGAGTFDLGRYTSPGNHLLSSGSTAPASYFSIDGGVTKLADYGQNSDPSDFLNSGVQGANDPFNEYYSGSTSQVLSTVDKQLLDSLGFSVNMGTPTGPSATTSSLVASSPKVTADGTSTTTLTVTVKDASGNAVAGTAVTLSASGSSNSFGTISGTTDANGVFKTTLASTLAQNETITATEGSVQEQTSVSFVAGAPSATTSSLVANAPTVTADGTSTTTLTVTVEDANGNAVANTAVTLSGSGSSNSFGAISGTTNANGVFTTTLASTLVQNETITATEGSVQEHTSVSFVAGAASAATSSIVAGSPTVTADGTSTTTLTVTVEDANGHAVAGTAVTLSGSGSANSFGAISGTTNANGVFTTTLASTLVQNEIITATEGSTQEHTSVSFVAGAPSATTSSLVASSPTLTTNGTSTTTPTVTADGTSTTTLTVTVEDAAGHAVAGTAVTLSGSGSANSFGTIFGTTNANGVFTTTLASTLAQNETITATEGNTQEHTSVSFVAGAPSATTSSIVASSPAVTANGTSTTTLTVTVEDAHGNAVAGTAVTLSGSGSSNSFGAISGTTNANGVFTTTLASTLVQNETITATEGSVQEHASVSFVPPASLPTLSVSNDPTATHGQAVSLSTLVTISDPSSVGYQKLELWDSNGTATGGQLVINGVAQTSGHEIDMTPANVANTVFDVGWGSDTLYARLLQNDGTTGGWQQITVTAPEPTTLSVSSLPTATHGQAVSLSTLVAISNPNSVGYQKLELWDSNGTAAGGQLVINGVAQTSGHEIDVTPANVANTVFDVGWGSDTLYARLLQNDGTTGGWQQITVTAPEPTTLSVTNLLNATKGQAVSLSTLVTISDPNSVGYQKLELWDSNGTAAGGQLVINGVAQTGGHEIDVTPADLANTVFDVGQNSDTLYARLLQNDGTTGGWQQITVTAPEGPTLSVSNDPTAAHGQAVSLSTLVTISDPNSVGYQKLELWDSNGTAAGGQLVINGVTQTGGHEIDMTPADVANTVFDVGWGSDTLYARLLQNDGTTGSWQQITVTAPEPTTLSVSNDPTATHGQAVSLSTLVTISDPNSAGYQKLELWDSNGTATGDQLVINGVAQTSGHEIDVTPANLANTVFDVGWGSETLYARLLQNDGTTGSWQQITVTAPEPTTLSVSNDPTATHGQAVSLSALVTISDPNSVGYQKLELWDSNGTATGGQLVINGVAQTSGHEIDVAPADLANTVFDVGWGSDTLYARLLQNDGTTGSWQQITVTAPEPTTLSVSNLLNPTQGQTVSLSTLVTISDPNSVGYQKLELWDSNGTATGGQLVINGVAQTGGHEIDLTPANVANTVFDVGQNSDTLYARLLQNDGTTGSWQQITVTAPVQPNAPLQTTSAGNVSAAASDQSFVFAPNFGQVTITSDTALAGIEFSHAVFANINALLAAAHDDGHGNVIITDAAHDTLTIQNMTSQQLNTHQSDFHIV